ncbi:MAG: hypothetical protein H0U75_05355 [Legionella sp.]|nr:hypothetical protein [Legionella sp.]
MEKTDPALSFQNPRMLAAIYFGLLSVVGTILTNALLISIGIDEAIPIFKAIILGVVVASATGALFGEKIIHCKKPFKIKTFWLGFIMVIASLPLFTLGLVYFITESDSNIFPAAKFHHWFYFYLYTLGYSYLLYGLLLAIASGFAALYLRGYLVYDVLHTHQSRQKRPHQNHHTENTKDVPHHH